MEIAEFQEALTSAKSGQEMLDLLETMEPSLEEKELGLGLLQVSQRLDYGGNDPEKVLSLAKRALDIFLKCENSGSTLPSSAGWVSPVICVLSVFGSSSFKLKKYDESLKYLEWANRNQKKLEDNYDPDSDEYDKFFNSIHNIQFLLYEVKKAMGRPEECVLDVTEKRFEEGSLDIAKACMSVCEIYLATLNAHEALPFCLKALDIYVKHLGNDSTKVASTRRCLGRIYNALGKSENDMGQVEKALEQLQLASSFFHSVVSTNEFLESEYERANELIELGRYDESLVVLKAVVSSDKAGGGLLVGTFMSMATAYCCQGKFQEARDLLKTAKKRLEMVEMEPFSRATALGDMALLHEKMNDNETAISLVRRAMAFPGLPQKLLVGYSDRLFMLIVKSCMGEHAILFGRGCGEAETESRS